MVWLTLTTEDMLSSLLDFKLEKQEVGCFEGSLADFWVEDWSSLYFVPQLKGDITGIMEEICLLVACILHF